MLTSLQSLREDIVNGWLAWVLTAGATLCVMWALRKILYILGKEEKVKPEHRKYLYGIASVFVFFILTYAQVIHRQLAEISAASPRKGTFRAGLLSVTQVQGVRWVDSSTNTPGTVPAFTMSGIGVNTTGPGVDVILIVKVDNSGPPSVAWNWRAFVQMPGGTRMPAGIPGSSGSNFLVHTVVGPFTCTPQNNLIQSLAVNPLPTGAGTIGWLMIHVSDVAKLPEGSTIILSFEDVYARPTTIEHRWSQPKRMEGL